MPQLTPDLVAQALMYLVVLLFSLSVHEAAHGWMALQMGDDTAARQGRITLNPLSHIDPFGTLLMPVLQIVYYGIPLLGWAKPTPVEARNFRRLARGHLLVAMAGPVANLLLAFAFTLGLTASVRLLGLPFDQRHPHPLTALLTVGVQINVVLALFNLLPLPPLDGFRVASWGLPRSISGPYDRVIAPFGPWLLLILVVTGALGWLLAPFTGALSGFLYGFAR